MGLGDVSQREEPKLAIVAAARTGGAISARIFTPHRCHPSIGVLGAISVAAGLRIEGSIVHSAIALPPGAPIRIEHPSGYFDVDIRLRLDGDRLVVGHIAVLQTARKIFDGRVWPRESAARRQLPD
jgi:4-oxalomesaconate tautomerase